MFYKVKAVQPLPANKLLVRFDSEEHRQYDVAPLFENGMHLRHWKVSKTFLNR